MIDGALAVIIPRLALKVVRLVHKTRQLHPWQLRSRKGEGRERSASNQEIMSSGSRHVRPFTAWNATLYRY